MRFYRVIIFIFLAFTFILNTPNIYCQGFDEVQITAQKVAGNIFMLQGQE